MMTVIVTKKITIYPTTPILSDYLPVTSYKSNFMEMYSIYDEHMNEAPNIHIL